MGVKDIQISFRQPAGVGNYLAVSPGAINPEFVRVRRHGDKMELYGDTWSMPLADVSEEWQFSERLELKFVDAEVDLKSEKDPV